MRISFKAVYLILLSFLIVSCSGNKRNAEQLLSEAQSLYNEGEYSLAKSKLDSIKILFPKAYDEIKSGMKLMQDIRMAENVRNIAFCDSMLVVSEGKKSEFMKQFDFVKDAEYHELGVYYPKSYSYNQSLNRSGLRAGVEEKGKMFIESILLNNRIKHNKIRVTTKSGDFAESLAVTSDGFNYSFTTLDKKYEVVRFNESTENGVINFIYTFQDNPISLFFVGNREASVSLTKAQINSVVQSFELSVLLLEIEKLKFEKEKSETLIRYLESKKD